MLLTHIVHTTFANEPFPTIDQLPFSWTQLLNPVPCQKCLPVQTMLSPSPTSATSSSFCSDLYRPLQTDLHSRIPVPHGSLVNLS